MGKYRWYIKEGGRVAHSIFCGWDGPERLDYYYTWCSDGPDVGYRAPTKEGWTFIGTSEDGWKFAKEQYIDIPCCVKCKAAITKRENDRKRAIESIEKDKAAAKKKKARKLAAKKKELAEQHSKLIKDIRSLVDSRKRSSNKMAEQIIRMVRDVPPKS